MAAERADVASAPVPAAEPQTAGCSPTGTALQFDGGYKVGMCYVTPDGTVGQAKAGVWASGQSGLLWFFDRGNAEVLVKVLDGCKINQHRWVFVAPVTTLEFNLRVTGPHGRNWTHSNIQGETASTKSDVTAFLCTVDASGLDFSLDAENNAPSGITCLRPRLLLRCGRECERGLRVPRTGRLNRSETDDGPWALGFLAVSVHLVPAKRKKDRK